MLSFDEGDIDVFFDSEDYLSSEESAVDEEIGSVHLEYGIWMNEPQSIEERRDNFLRGIGLAEFSSPRICAEIGMEVSGLSGVMGLERLKQSSGAVSSSCISSTDLAEGNMVCCRRERSTQAKALFDELEGKQEDRQKQKVVLDGKATEHSTSAQEYKNSDLGKRRLKNWLNHLMNKRKGSTVTFVTQVSKPNSRKPKIDRMKVWQKNKRYMEFTALFNGQEIGAHNGLIWTMKFSPDGQYLASGGEDGVVRIWRVTSVDASDNYLMVRSNLGIKVKGGKSTLGGKSMNHASIVIPDKVFHIEESPVHEFHGHSSGVLDLSWSHSNFLLSSSKDKTVHLWKLGCTECYNVFRHNDYVTCVQFNPIDDSYFISGSIDGKVRIWGVSEKRVVDWADVRDVITAICYKPDGNGFIVGSITGTCRFYDTSGKHLKLDAQICVQGKKRTSANKITGIQFCQEISQRVMISSEDSKLHIFDGIDIIRKYRGLPKSGSQMSASFTTSGKHIVSVGEDSRVYLWNYNGTYNPASKQTKSVRSCEHFFSKGVTVAIPWSIRAGWIGSGSGATESSQTVDLDSEPSSPANWFSMDGSCWGSATWPEEKLPMCDVPVSEYESHDQHKHRTISDAWGAVIVTAGCDGAIKTFHNYGLPIRF